MRRRWWLLLVVLVGLLLILLWPREPAEDADQADGFSVVDMLTGEQAAEGYARVTGPEALNFPEDHGAHPEYRHEWWYVTGNLHAENNRHFGYQITFFRFNVDPEATHGESAWSTNQVWMAHLALTDTETGRYFHHERFARGAAGLAGADVGPFRVWLEDWRLEGEEGEDIMPLQLTASEGDIAVSLTLEAAKPLVLQGDRGYSQKGPEPGNASRYFSYTRLRTVGELNVEGETFQVQGLSWMDREWGSSVLSEEQRGWDWFSLQLDDGVDIMFYTLRLRDGDVDPRSKGVWVEQDGSYTVLPGEAIELEVVRHWDSPAGDASYPVAWRLRIPGRDLALEVEAILDDQELRTGFRYWEGAVRIRGEREGSPVRGHGYAELTGYAE
jgi:predicted secreted hydrolase